MGNTPMAGRSPGGAAATPGGTAAGPLEVIPLYGECEKCTKSGPESTHPALDLTDADDRVRHIRKFAKRIACGNCLSEAIADGMCLACGESSVVERTECRECYGRVIPLPGVYTVAEPTNCHVCFTDNLFFVRPARCAETLCLDCYLGQLRQRMGEREFMTLKDAAGNVSCLTVSGCVCGGCRPPPAAAPQIMSFVGKTLWSQFGLGSAEAFIAAQADGCMCPFPGCASAQLSLPPVADVPVVQCNDCKRWFCRHPGCKAHPAALRQRDVWVCPATVAVAVDPMAYAIAERQRIRDDVRARKDVGNKINQIVTPCPKACGRLMCKDDNCSHVTCGCGHKFCWVCLGPQPCGLTFNKDGSCPCNPKGPAGPK